MPTFSYTAPQVTLEEEKIQRENLTEEEREALHRDLFGGPSTFVETPEMLQSASSKLKQAMDQIPIEEKSVYLEALEKVPELVERECDPIAFMRREMHNPDLAARRMIEYWKCRKQLFGTKLFLPMTMDGALSDDIATIAMGIFMILPEDQHGRPVFLF